MRMFSASIAVALSFVLSEPLRPSHDDVLFAAQEQLRRSHLPRRLPVRAPEASTFGRFLAGHPAPRVLSRALSNSGTPTVNVFDFGADPTCSQDSSDAFDAAMSEALLHDHGHGMGGRGTIRDLGGVTIDLQGGDYLLSRPIAVPEWVGNMRIVGGTIRASPDFPADRYMIEVGGDSKACNQENKQHSCNENIGFEDLFFDGSLVAKGGLEINATMGGNVGPDIFFVHFGQVGLTLRGGHEVMVHQAWFGKLYYDEKHPEELIDGSVGIEVLGNDHVISDVIGFLGTQTGVHVTGAATLLEGIHLWNMGTLAGGRGIVLSGKWADNNRLNSCYLDYTSLIIEDPFHVSVTNGFFLGMATIVLRAGAEARVEGLTLLSNTWHNANMPRNDTVVLDERGGSAFGSVKDFVMLGNVADADKFTTRAVTVTRSLTQAATTRWEFDFSDALVFPSIDLTSVSYSIAIAGSSFARHAARPAQHHTVVVETDEPVDATVTVTVSQSLFSAGNSAALLL